MIFRYQICSSLYLSTCMYVSLVICCSGAVWFGDMDVFRFFSSAKTQCWIWWFFYRFDWHRWYEIGAEKNRLIISTVMPLATKRNHFSKLIWAEICKTNLPKRMRKMTKQSHYASNFEIFESWFPFRSGSNRSNLGVEICRGGGMGKPNKLCGLPVFWEMSRDYHIRGAVFLTVGCFFGDI